MPEGLEYIDHDAFALMENLRYVHLPESLNQLNAFAFQHSQGTGRGDE